MYSLTWAQTLGARHVFNPAIEPGWRAAGGHGARRSLSGHFHGHSQQVHLFPRGVQHVVLPRQTTNVNHRPAAASSCFTAPCQHPDSHWHWSDRTVCRRWTAWHTSSSTLCWASSRCASARCPDGGDKTREGEFIGKLWCVHLTDFSGTETAGRWLPETPTDYSAGRFRRSQHFITPRDESAFTPLISSDCWCDVHCTRSLDNTAHGANRCPTCLMGMERPMPRSPL